MINTLSFISSVSLTLSLLFFSPINEGSDKMLKAETVDTKMTNSTAADMSVVKAEKIYDSLQLDDSGLSKEALQYAVKGYDKLVAEGAIENPDIITIADFSQSSRKKRLYVIDLKNFKLVQNTYVAHGRNSGVDYATKFSNKMESYQSSLGFYVTANTYAGKHGLSLRMQGVDENFNDRAFDRAVVVHGADYIGEHRLGSNYMGRSFGCPAVPTQQAKKLINTIKDGTCLFIYHPSAKYINESRILNG